MVQDDVRDRVKNYISPHINGRVLSDDEDMFALGYVNSLFAMQLVAFVEREFSLQFGADDLRLENFRTVGRLVHLIDAKTSAAI
jgi:methoxymalonate biosynthesis acyl carrier protein